MDADPNALFACCSAACHVTASGLCIFLQDRSLRYKNFGSILDGVKCKKCHDLSTRGHGRSQLQIDPLTGGGRTPWQQLRPETIWRSEVHLYLWGKFTIRRSPDVGTQKHRDAQTPPVHRSNVVLDDVFDVKEANGLVGPSIACFGFFVLGHAWVGFLGQQCGARHVRGSSIRDMGRVCRVLLSIVLCRVCAACMLFLWLVHGHGGEGLDCFSPFRVLEMVALRTEFRLGLAWFGSGHLANNSSPLPATVCGSEIL